MNWTGIPWVRRLVGYYVFEQEFGKSPELPTVNELCQRKTKSAEDSKKCIIAVKQLYEQYYGIRQSDK